MALIAIAADKGSPGVTTTALALAAAWPRPVLLAECDPAGGDLVYRFPAPDGEGLDPRRGLLSLAVAARRGLQSHQVWEHAQKLNGGLDVLTGVTNAEQGAGLNPLWGQVGRVLADVPQADVIADCGRIGADGPPYDLLAEASVLLLLTKPEMGEVIRLRDRVNALTAALDRRGRRGLPTAVAVIADQRHSRRALGEVGHVVAQAGSGAQLIGAIADDPGTAAQLGAGSGTASRLAKSPLMRTAHDIAGQLATVLPPLPAAVAEVPQPGSAHWQGPPPVPSAGPPPPYGQPSQASLAAHPPASDAARPGRHSGSPAQGGGDQWSTIAL
jgi:cellulose biosynthesis protein BcsQ